MSEDRQLLVRYVEGSDQAFGELVRRHVSLVYGTALRRVSGDAHLAQDVAQLVFTELARKARFLPEKVVLTGWLHRATCYIAAQILRTERRRRAREEKAVAMELTQTEAPPQWEELRPLVDEALEQLGTADRDALLLRFFQQRSLAEVGEALGASEEAARKRVDRALEKLRQHLSRRGITASAGVLAALLWANALQSAPTGLAALLAGGALTSAASTGWLALLLLRFMALTKLQTATACLLLAAAPVALQWHALATARARTPVLQNELTQLAEDAAIQGWALEQAERRSRYAENALAEARTDIATHLARIRAAGGTNDPDLYLWSEASEYVRLPKSLARQLTLSGTFTLPDNASPEQMQNPAVYNNGALSDTLVESLGVTSQEQLEVHQAFQEFSQAYRDLVQSHSYFTNTAPAEFNVGNREVHTWVTAGFAMEGQRLQERLHQQVEAALGPERAGLVWQQAEGLFREEFNDFGSRTRLQTVALGPNKTLTLWNVSKLPTESSFSSWSNTSGQLNPESVPEPLRSFAKDWLAGLASKEHP